MGSGEVAIVALSTMISLKVTFSDGLGGQNLSVAGFSTESIPVYVSHGSNFRSHDNLDA